MEIPQLPYSLVDNCVGEGGVLCMDTLDLPQEQNGLPSQPEKVFRPRTANLEAEQYALRW